MMSTAGLAGVGRVAVMRTTWPVVRQKLLSLVAISAVWLAAPVLGLPFSGWSAALLAVGAVAVEAWPTSARQISVAVAVALLAVREPRYAPLHLALVGAVWVARRRTATLALTLVTGALFLPKAAFSVTDGRALADGWLDPAGLATLIFVTLYWWREARSARAPAGGATSWGDWCAL